MMGLFQNFVIVFIGALNDSESLRKKLFNTTTLVSKMIANGRQ